MCVVERLTEVAAAARSACTEPRVACIVHVLVGLEIWLGLQQLWTLGLEFVVWNLWFGYVIHFTAVCATCYVLCRPYTLDRKL